jgi:hypothetical protein
LRQRGHLPAGAGGLLGAGGRRDGHPLRPRRDQHQP